VRSAFTNCPKEHDADWRSPHWIKPEECTHLAQGIMLELQAKEFEIVNSAIFKRQQISLQDRLSAWAGKVREQAETMDPGREKDALLKKATQAEHASHVDDWINSPAFVRRSD
jgi:hypothetical protein